jgi:hypothetical protein
MKTQKLFINAIQNQALLQYGIFEIAVFALKCRHGSCSSINQSGLIKPGKNMEVVNAIIGKIIS